MLVDDHLLYHPSWDQPDPRAGELHQPAPLCLRPTVDERHHWVCVLCSVSCGGASKYVKKGKEESLFDGLCLPLEAMRASGGASPEALAPCSADRMGQNDQDKNDNADTKSSKPHDGEDQGDQDDNITKSDLDVTFQYLNEDYDWDNEIRVAKGKSGSDGKTFEYYICFDDLRDAGEAIHVTFLSR
ncbi:hypothetical protein KC333_g6301 [Hortaea werneckii]|nr:hypothetical protein KC333_g6301 [Hortaea werneckii]KAI7306274.1 hypothetical protein KC326_g7907 [Hortaea werneckii]